MKYLIYVCLAAGGVLALVAVFLFMPRCKYVVDGYGDWLLRAGRDEARPPGPVVPERRC